MKVEKAKIVVLIETKSVIGEGTKESPVRVITQYWDLEGNLKANNDYSVTEGLR